MNENFIFLDSGYDEGVKSAWAEVRYKGHNYYGYAYCNPEDYENGMLGQWIAEQRAEISALKNELKKAKEEYNTCKHFVSGIFGYKNFDWSSVDAWYIRKQLYFRKRNIKNIKDAITVRKQAIEQKVEQHENYMKQVNRIRKKGRAPSAVVALGNLA